MTEPVQIEPPVGTFRGDLEALDAAAQRVEVWCGPKQGWRRLGARVGPACCIVQVYGRLLAGPSYHVEACESLDMEDSPNG